MSPTAAFALVAGGVVAVAIPRRPPGRHRSISTPPHPSAASALVPGWWHDVLLLHAPTADPGRSWTVARAVTGAVTVLALVLIGPVAGLALAALVVAGPRLLQPGLRRRMAARRDAQLPAALERLAASLRAGVAPGPAFSALARSTPPPLGDDLRAAALEVEHGASLADAIDRWGQRAATPDVWLTTAALSLASHVGGAIARPVDRVASTIRERRELQAEVHALATQARASALVLTLAPAAFTTMVSTIDPGVPRFLLGSPAGLACLVAGVALQGAGAAWSARILRSAA